MGKRRYTKEIIIGLLKMKAKELGRMPKKVEIDKDPRLPSYEICRQYIGKMRQLSEAVGDELLFARKLYEPEEIYNELKEWANKLGRMPKRYEVKESPAFPSPTSIDRLLGSWKALGRKIGFPPNCRKRYTDAELLRILKMKVDELGRAPKVKEVLGDASSPSMCSYIAHFGSLGRALDLIGCKNRRRRRRIRT